MQTLAPRRSDMSSLLTTGREGWKQSRQQQQSSAGICTRYISYTSLFLLAGSHSWPSADTTSTATQSRYMALAGHLVLLAHVPGDGLCQ